MTKSLGLPCCHLAPHVPDPRPGHLTMSWIPARLLAERVRVRDYTCACAPTCYELCQSGGEYFIRRSRRIDEEVVIEETHRTIYAKALVAWTRLLDGTSC
ncbi:hypothetical protein [Nonomuraea sp. B19D2]|uniref:hypothetical protein n=1 Tax=Nonomuraea sp. B19D2 TaxID=3159561 RepID=UPI0032DBA63C